MTCNLHLVHGRDVEEADSFLAAKSLTCAEVGSGGATYRIELLFQKPRSFKSNGTGIDFYCNGKNQFNHIVADKTYFRREISALNFSPPNACLS